MNDRFEELKQNLLPRFWDTENKEMVYPEYDEADKLFYYDIKNKNGLGVGYGLDEMLLNPRFIPMKPTGLKDKNGKLIYENDELKDDEVNVVKIIFKDGCFYISNGQCGMTIDQADLSEYEIIGNIHENF